MTHAANRPVIALLAGPTTSASVLYGLYDVLFAAGAVYPDMVVGAPGRELLDVRIISADTAAFRCPGGVPVEPQGSIADPQSFDAVLVCDMYSPITSAPHADYAVYRDWLRAQHASGALIASVCLGALVLAEAGLLDGRETASHWAYGELFAREYPATRLMRDSILCLTHEGEGIVTAGGVTSWQELALYLIKRFCGQDVARQTAKVYLLAGHEDGQLPYAAMNRTGAQDAVIGACQEWIAANYREANPVQRMVDLSGLNARTFARRFRAATGRSAIDYVVNLRIEEAKQVLETGEMPVDEVAWEVGYQDPAAFRRMFRKCVSMTPQDYRRRYARLGTGR